MENNNDKIAEILSICRATYAEGSGYAGNLLTRIVGMGLLESVTQGDFIIKESSEVTMELVD